MSKGWIGLPLFLGWCCALIPAGIPLGDAMVRASESGLKDLHLDSLHEQAPDFSFTDENGKEHRLSEFRGKPLILHLWASWCTSCERELPELAASSRRWSKSGIQFLAVTVDPPEKKGDATRLLNRLHPRVPLWIASSSSDSTRAYWAWGLPMTYLVNPQGVIVARAMGARKWTTVSDRELLSVLRKP